MRSSARPCSRGPTILEMPLSTTLFRLGRLERRGHAEAVESRLGSAPVGALRAGLAELRDAIGAELDSRP